MGIISLEHPNLIHMSLGGGFKLNPNYLQIFTTFLEDF